MNNTELECIHEDEPYKKKSGKHIKYRKEVKF